MDSTHKERYVKPDPSDIDKLYNHDHEVHVKKCHSRSHSVKHDKKKKSNVKRNVDLNRNATNMMKYFVIRW